MRNSAVNVRVSDQITNKPLPGAKVDLDPYGLEAITNEVGAACFGNLRVPEAWGCIIASLTVTARGYGVFQDRNFVVPGSAIVPRDAQLGRGPITQARASQHTECARTP